jgi:mono/diheme cytochrome c family protein
MKRYLLSSVLAGSLVAAQAPVPAATAVQEEHFSSSIRPFLTKNCQACHSGKNKTGGVAVDQLTSAASLETHAGAWEKILRKVKTGEMPPAGFPKPTPAVAAAFTNWAETELDRLAALRPDPGRVTLHRLNRTEYNNAVRDLLAVDFTPADDFPADDAGYGFDNIADVLSLPPLLMEKYLNAAGKVSRQALGLVKVTPALDKYSADRKRSQKARISDDLPFGSRGGLLVKHRFPADGEYLLRIRLSGQFDSSLPPPQLDVRLDGARIKLLETPISMLEEEEEKRRFEVRVPIAAGHHQVGVTFLEETWKTEDALPRLLNVDFIEIGGPFNAKANLNSASRQRIFTCKEQTEACAQTILTGLARKAYRRPVTAAETVALMRFFRMGREDGGHFDTGIQLALKSMLVSPNFLFRLERAGTPMKVGEVPVERITDLDLASRLSFFLWSSIPDDELLTLATQKKLHQPEVLKAQVKRMLADTKSRSLVTNFAGQWLHLRNLSQWKPDPDKFPEFDAELRESMGRETELFFEAVMREDRSVLDFLDGPFSYLNERLAKYYGIPGVEGSRFRRVALTGEQRSGVLTQGSILTVSSYPTRTSPVIRGKWILENFLAAPPPPPPPNVPELNAEEIGQSLSMRQQLEQHRTNPACASCHTRMDAIGFALENYDAIGRWRTHDGKFPIDPSGTLNGADLKGAADLKALLRSRQDEFVGALTEKLLTYALGRGLERADKPVVRSISRSVAREEYRFSSLVQGIVESLPFQMRRPSIVSSVPPAAKPVPAKTALAR